MRAGAWGWSRNTRHVCKLIDGKYVGIDLVCYLPRLLSNIQGLFCDLPGRAGDFSTILNLVIPSRAHIIPTGTKASPYAAYSIASSTHTPPLPPAPVLVVARHVASGLLPKCEGGRRGSLLARNTGVATAPGIRPLPLAVRRWKICRHCS